MTGIPSVSFDKINYIHKSLINRIKRLSLEFQLNKEIDFRMPLVEDTLNVEAQTEALRPKT
jgi:hypothetical protein